MASKDSQQTPKPPRETGSGVVKQVMSGDTVVVYRTDVPARNGPPPEQEITLSMLTVPRLGRRGEEDEPWAWASREFLRENIIGKKITFSVEHKNADTGRCYCVVHQGEDNVQKKIAEAGWASVRRPPDGKTPRNDLHKELIAAAELAEQEKKGIFQGKKAGAVRPVHKHIDAIALYEKLKNRPIEGIIEYVRDGSFIRVEMLPTHHSVMFQVAGAQAPIFDKSETGAQIPRPFAREAKHFTETHLLNRKVTLTLRGVSKNDVFTGTVEFLGRDLGIELLKSGLATFVRWNAPQDRADELQQAENIAKEQNMRIWRNFVPDVATVSSEFAGKVVDIQNRGILVVNNAASGKDVTIYLASVQVPAIGAYGQRKTDEPLSWEAKEFLRSKLIGKRVNVLHDYVREASTNREGREFPERDYYTVMLGNANIALSLVERGLAKVMNHFDEKRSRAYQALVIAEKKAQSKGKGIWKYDQSTRKTASGESYSYKLNDLTLKEKKKDDDDAKEKGEKGGERKTKQMLPFLQRAGTIPAVVDYVLSASKLKLHIPKENCMVFFSFEAVRIPRTEDEFGAEALEFVRSKLHQRDVEVVISGADKGGNFLGTLYVNRTNFNCQILSNGLGKVIPPAAERSDFKVELFEAEETAKAKKRKIWQNWDEAAEKAKREERRAARAAEYEQQQQQNREIINVTVTEIVSGGSFYVHRDDAADTLAQINQELNGATLPSPSPDFTKSITKKSKCVCQFSDSKYYRVEVLALSEDQSEVQVLFLDYGNVDYAFTADLLPVPASLASIPPQAVECTLAFLNVRAASEDYGEEAALQLRDLVWGKKLTANVEAREDDVLHLSLGDPASKDLVNVSMVKAGYALVQRRPTGYNPALLSILKETQQAARAAHAGMWEYGDVADDEPASI